MTHDAYLNALATIRRAARADDLNALETSLDAIGPGDSDVAVLLQLIDEKRELLSGPHRPSATPQQ